MAENLRDYQVLARRDEENIGHLSKRLEGEDRLALVPHLDDDVHDVAGLDRVARYLFATDAERARMLAAETVA